MSDDEEEYSFTRQRRALRSCDFCRTRKIRCQKPRSEGDEKIYADDGPCAGCLKFGAVCRYTYPVVKRGPKNRLVDELRREITSLKAQLRSLSLCRLCAQPLAQPEGLVFSHSSPESDITSSSGHKEPAEEPDGAGDELVARFGRFSLESIKTSYFGSAFAPVHDNDTSPKDAHPAQPLLANSRRPMYWEMSSWEREAYRIRTPRFVYPDNDLMESLVNLYFANFHPTTPVVHRPSVEQAIAEGLHLRDVGFGGVLLAILGLASRYSSDPRVLIDGNSLSAGWKFINQIRIPRRLFEPTIHEVQIYCLMSYYALQCSVPQIAWVYIGIGIRFLQQRGQYKQKPKGYKINAEDELWKRTFWSFAVLERMLCLILGHPMCLHIENYDIDFPLEVNDEYWDQDLTQPPGMPSQLTYFVWHLKLCEIVGETTRKLYGSRKSKMMMGWDGPQWEQRVVGELDLAMNDFLDSIPAHLRWDSTNPPTGVFFDQSATLHLTYNYARIAIHRPFIHKRHAVLSSSSLASCINAARAVVHIADAWLSKLQRIPLPSLINPVFISGIILVLNMIATKRAGLSMDHNEDPILVDTAMEILKFAEYRLQTVGRLRDLLAELKALHDPESSKPEETIMVDAAPSMNVSDTSYTQLPPSTGFSEASIANGSASNVPDAFYSQIPPQSVYMNEALAAHHAQSPRGTHVEELLADTKLYTMDGALNDELLSVWMTAPDDRMFNAGNWAAYLAASRNVNVNVAADTRWNPLQQ
ncbi:Zn(2)-C6 fungal-type domain-containing protein [Favolaschia claudopus]|uniref:Zn(2)-C6 fungal-type domain-containing protein n=1 Tax=Favolaschia claudopus TaxID=2862362 RepID=A0AAW0D952_9AGAR